jgi:zinc protease
MKKIASVISEIELFPGSRIFVAPRKTKGLIKFQGSLYTEAGSLPLAKNMLPELAAELLDAGTASRTKEEIRESLAERGAELSFTVMGERMHFSGACLPEDLKMVIGILAECLAQPAFPKKELEAARERLAGELVEEKTNTRAQAAGALARRMYATNHPNFVPTTKDREKSLSELTRSDLVRFAKSMGRGGFVCAFVGDISVDAAKRSLGALKKLGRGTEVLPVQISNQASVEAIEDLIVIPDKANIDVFLGTNVRLTHNDLLYLPFNFVCDMLGGKGLFSGHLMRTIRERDGLTYGIYVVPYGFENARDGLLRIWATFSPDTFKTAVESTRKEIRLFFKHGLVEEAIEERKERLKGVYLVGLSTNRGLAAVLHAIGREGKPLSYVDDYSMLVDKITLADLQKAAALIPLDRLSLAAAGTFKA